MVRATLLSIDLYADQNLNILHCHRLNYPRLFLFPFSLFSAAFISLWYISCILQYLIIWVSFLIRCMPLKYMRDRATLQTFTPWLTWNFKMCILDTGIDTKIQNILCVSEYVWRHDDAETLPALLPLFEENSPVSSGFPHSSADLLFYVCWSNLLNSRVAGDMMTSSNGNIFRVTGPLCGEFAGHRWIPLTKASDAELWLFIWPAREKTIEQTM